jgi:hypothetical protein
MRRERKRIDVLAGFTRRTPAMRASRVSTFGLTASIALTALAGCGGSAQMASSFSGQVPGITTQSGQQAQAQGEAKVPGGLYVEQSTDSLPEYSLPDKKNLGPRCSERTNGASNGIAVDARRILYVPYNVNAAHGVQTFGPDCGAQGPTLIDPNADVGDVAVDNKNNTVYVSNISTGGIDVYKKGATMPTSSLSNSQYRGNGFGVAVDRFGNVFNSGGTIVEFSHGQNKGSKALALSGLISPQGLSFDGAGDLLVTNEYNIAIYAPPYSGAPKQTISTQAFCTYSALDRQNKNLYVSEQTNNAVDVYAYPSGAFEYSIPVQQRYVQGIALDPPSKT